MTVLDDVHRRSRGRACVPEPAARPPRRSAVVIGMLAVLGALWTGLAAPHVSPVGGTPPDLQQVQPAADVQVVAPLPQDQPFGPRAGGRGRR